MYSETRELLPTRLFPHPRADRAAEVTIQPRGKVDRSKKVVQTRGRCSRARLSAYQSSPYLGVPSATASTLLGNSWIKRRSEGDQIKNKLLQYRAASVDKRLSCLWIRLLFGIFRRNVSHNTVENMSISFNEPGDCLIFVNLTDYGKAAIRHVDDKKVECRLVERIFDP